MFSAAIEIDLKDTQLETMGLPFAVTVRPGMPLEEVLDTIRANATGSVLIQEGDNLLGIFTERDFLRRILGKNIALGEPIEKFMTKSLVTISHHAHLEEAVKLLIAKGIRHLPVIDEEQNTVRILSVRDVLEYLSEFFPKEVLNLPLDSTQKFHQKEGG